MSKYTLILQQLAEGKDLVIASSAAPETVRSALYKQLKRVNLELVEMGMSLDVIGIKVSSVGEGKLLVTAKSKEQEIEILETINRGELPNEEEL